MLNKSCVLAMLFISLSGMHINSMHAGAPSPPDEQSSNPAEKLQPEELTDDELRGAMPERDESGARWRTRLGQNPYRRKEDLVGRPSRFFVRQHNILTPFRDRLLSRNLADGLFGTNPIKFPGEIRQINGSTNWMWTAGLFDAQGDNPSADIALLRHLPEGIKEYLKGHRIAPWHLVFSPDGTRLVSCSDDESMRLWNVDTGKEISKSAFYGYGSNGSQTRGDFAAFSPDGTHLATAFKNEVTFRDSATGAIKTVWQPWQPFAMGQLSAVRFSNDGNSLFAFAHGPRESQPDRLAFIQFDFTMPFDPIIRRFKGNHSAIDALVVPDEKHIITWNGSPEVRIWDLDTKKEVAVLNVAPKSLYDLTLSPRGTFLVTAGDDGEIKFWDLATRKQKPTKHLYRHEAVDCVKLSSDGKYLVTASDDGWLKVWDAPEFVHDLFSTPVRMEVRADGTIQDIYLDGMVKYRQATQDAR